MPAEDPAVGGALMEVSQAVEIALQQRTRWRFLELLESRHGGRPGSRLVTGNESFFRVRDAQGQPGQDGVPVLEQATKASQFFQRPGEPLVQVARTGSGIVQGARIGG